MRAWCSGLLLLLLILPLGAGEESSAQAKQALQPLLLPWEHLQSWLQEQEGEWMLLPYEQWQALRAASAQRLENLAAAQAAHQAQGSGSSLTQTWISAGQVELRIDTQRRLLLAEAHLQVHSLQEDAHPFRLLQSTAAQDFFLGSLRINDTDALWRAVNVDGYLERRVGQVVIPGPGSYQFKLQWQQLLRQDAHDPRLYQAKMPLPLAASLSLLWQQPEQGSWYGKTPQGAGGLTELPVAWRSQPRLVADGQILGIEQDLRITGSQEHRNWQSRIQLRPLAGNSSEYLELQLPPGMILLQANTGGRHAQALRIQEEDERLLIGPLAGQSELRLSGLLETDAAIAPPQIKDATWQRHIVELLGIIQSDPPPQGWWPQAARSGNQNSQQWLVEEGAEAWSFTSQELAIQQAQRIAARAVLARETQHLRQHVELHLAAGRHFFLLVDPADWQLDATQQIADGLAIEAHADGLRIYRPDGAALAQDFTILLDWQRKAPTVPAVLPLRLPRLVGLPIEAARLDIACDPILELRLQAPQPWRQDPAAAAERWLSHSLLSAGAAPDLVLDLREQPAQVQADAVLTLLPGRQGEDSWLRLDLQLTLAAGSLPQLVIEGLPWDIERIQGPQAADLRQAEDGTLSLHFHDHWQGRRLIHLAASFGQSSLEDLRLRDGQGAEIPLRRWLRCQYQEEQPVQIQLPASAQTLAEDELPEWSPALEQLASLGAWQLADGRALELAWQSDEDAPRLAAEGFIDAYRIQLQISPQGQLLHLYARIAAPEQDLLPLQLPAGSELIDMQVDGQLQRPVQHPESGLAIALPGRTVSELEMRIRLPGADAGRYTLRAPQLGDIPVLKQDWDIALTGPWLLRPLSGSQSIALTRVSASEQASWRGWFRSWPDYQPQPPPLASRSRSLPADARSRDPRILGADQEGRPVQSLPLPALQGERLQGQGLDGQGLLQIELLSIEGLQTADRWGRMIGLLLSLFLLYWLRGLRPLPILLASFLSSLLLHHLQWGAGGLLAACEWASLLLFLALLLRFALSLKGAFRGCAPVLIASLLCFSLLAGEEGSQESSPIEPVMMGYTALDEAGRPVGIQVAVSAEELQRLLAQRPEDIQAAWDLYRPHPLHTLLLGSASVHMRPHQQGVDLHIRMPIASLAQDWVRMRWPVSDMIIQSIRVTDQDGQPWDPQRWGTAEGGSRNDILVDQEISIHGPMQGTLHLELSLLWEEKQGEWVNPLRHIGGSISVDETVDGRVLHINDLPISGNTAIPNTEKLKLRWLPAQEGPVMPHSEDVRWDFEQDLQVHLRDAHIDWQASFNLRRSAQSSEYLRIELPDGLLLSRVEGEALLGWQQQQDSLLLHLDTDPRSLHIQAHGVLLANRQQGIMLHCRLPAAQRSSGRIGLRADSGLRFLRPRAEELQRVSLRDQEQLAFSFRHLPDALRIHWERRIDPLHLQQLVLLRDDGHWLHLALHLRQIAGTVPNHLRIPLPEPWQLVGSKDLGLIEDADERSILLQSQQLQQLHQGYSIHLRAPLHDLDAAPLIPLIFAHPQVLTETIAALIDPLQRWQLPESSAGPAIAGSERQGLLHLAPHPDEQLRWIGRWRGEERPQLQPAAARSGLEDWRLAHYLQVRDQQVDWWIRADAQASGKSDHWQMRIPRSWQLRTVSAPGLSHWHVDEEGLLQGFFATPVQGPLRISIHAQHRLDEQLRVGALELPGRIESQVVSLSEDSLRLLRYQHNGLQRTEVDADWLPQSVYPHPSLRAWRAHSDWSLDILAEDTTAVGGSDGLATLLEIDSLHLPSGVVRARARWHLQHRSGNQLILRSSANSQLWRLRVDGIQQPFQQGLEGESRILVPPLRPGEAQRIVEVIWQQEGPLEPPRLQGILVQQTLWSLRWPPEAEIEVQERAPWQRLSFTQAQHQRAQHSLEIGERLLSQGEVSAVSLRRQGQSLLRLQGSLADQFGLVPEAQRDAGLGQRQQQLQQELANLESLLSEQQERREQLGFTQASLTWSRLPSKHSAQPLFPDPPALVLAWMSSPQASSQSLPNPPLDQELGPRVLGIDLLPRDSTPNLQLSARGAPDLPPLQIRVQESAQRPWWILALILFLLCASTAASLRLLRIRRE